MVKKISTCVFVTGKGSNLNILIKKAKSKIFPIKIELVISNNIKSNGLKIAKKHGIKAKFIEFKNQNTFESKALNELKINKIKFICLAGFMKILSPKFIKTFSYKIINIHPSLLPKFKGLNTFERVLKNSEKKTGCTVHYVSEKVDAGKIITQKSFFIQKNDNEKILKRKTQKLEYTAFSEAIRKIYRYN